MSGEGEAGRNGGPTGDLYVEVRVREHAIFERDGAHLSCEVPISFATATLGGTLDVPTLDGDVTIKVPAETQSGRVFRLRDKGIKPVRGGQTGDLFCRVVVETPVSLTREQKELLAELRRIAALRTSKRHHPREETWLDGVKRFFTSLGESYGVMAAYVRDAGRTSGRMGRAHRTAADSLLRRPDTAL